MHDDSANARRRFEDVVGQLAARNDAVGFTRQAADGIGAAVGSANDVRPARERRLALGRDGVGEQDCFPEGQSDQALAKAA
jgi:hypothetical protein